ncbi:MAG TPA: uroporphyrinogen decarboxylase family protein, partial [Clostridia bacterium]|nr:uroporphyrinogen decarboxylase family protein [Clostridia bacterium]
MNGYRKPNKNRLLTAFEHKIPDRVPNFEVLVDNPTFSHVMGRRVEGHTLSNIDPYVYIEFVSKIGQDAIGLSFYDKPFRYVDDNGNIRLLDFKISSRRDFERLLPPNLDHMAGSFDLLRRYQEAVKGTDIGLFVLTGSFFCDTYDSIVGFENFMYLLYDEPDLIDEILEIQSRYYAEMTARLMEYNLDFLYIGDDIAYKTGTLINPSLLRKLWKERMDRIMRPAREKGIPIMFHSDGNIIDMIPDIIDLGVCALNPIEPYGMDIVEVKKRFGRNLTLV